MRVGVLSDVHGNLDGFEACVADMGPVDALLFGGDLLGYYFDGPKILRRLRALGAQCLLGNHDLYFLSHLGRPVPHEIPTPSRDEYRKRYGPSLELAAAELTTEELDFLAGLRAERRLTLAGRTILHVHGSPWRPGDEYVYPDFPAFERFDSVDADVVLMGHTHRPFVRERNGRWLVNVGSCGQPRDGEPRVSYAIVELGTSVRCELHRVAYDRAPLLERCRALAPECTLLTELLLREKKPVSAGARGE